MGDKDRFEAFADFISAAFPHAKCVADVAGGGGMLSLALAERDYLSVVIDPRDTDLPSYVKTKFRKNARATGKMMSIARIREPIESVDLARFDLMVGLHPDAATEWIVRRASALGKPFAVIPCCVVPIDGLKRSTGQWIEYLVSLAPGSRTATLPISGRNIVIYQAFTK